MLPAILAVTIMILSLTGCATTDQPTFPQEPDVVSGPPLTIYWIDVDGGAATLIVTPAGESVLVDAGEDRESHASRIYQVAGQVAGLTQIDHFVATHWHGDHYAGASRLNQRIPIKNFYDHGLPSQSDYASKADLQRARAGIEAYEKTTQGRSQELKPGDILPLGKVQGLPKVILKCLAASGQFTPTSAPSSPNPFCENQTAKPPDETDNAMSVVLLLSYGRFSFLDPGDLTWQMEAKLVCPVNQVGTVDLFQISHHGLDSSNNPVLIESLQPRVVVINNAPEKGAEPNTMRTLMGMSWIETIWQIHRNTRTGAELNTQVRFMANPEGQAGEFIKASARPDGSFSVQIGRDGTVQTYQSKSAGARLGAKTGSL